MSPKEFDPSALWKRICTLFNPGRLIYVRLSRHDGTVTVYQPEKPDRVINVTDILSPAKQSTSNIVRFLHTYLCLKHAVRSSDELDIAFRAILSADRQYLHLASRFVDCTSKTDQLACRPVSRTEADDAAILVVFVTLRKTRAPQAT